MGVITPLPTTVTSTKLAVSESGPDPVKDQVPPLPEAKKSTELDHAGAAPNNVNATTTNIINPAANKALFNIWSPSFLLFSFGFVCPLSR
jgi:hypothetical protein